MITLTSHEKLKTLIQRKCEELHVSLVKTKTDTKGNVHLLMKRNRDGSHVVWTAHDTGEPLTTYSDFYQGEYDLTYERGLQELTRRCNKANK
jgi:hypothetical protein